MKKYFLTGLVTLLPLAVTLWFVTFIVGFLTKPFTGIVVSLLKQLSPFESLPETTIRTMSQILILIALLLFTFFLGLLARRYFFKGVIKLGEKVLAKIPVVNKVYKTVKEIVKSLFSNQGQSFKQVVLVPFPQATSYAIGLVTGDAPLSTQNAVSVFIPAAPNPMTGFLLMMESHKLIPLEMKTDEALKYIVSCAVIQPGQKQ